MSNILASIIALLLSLHNTEVVGNPSKIDPDLLLRLEHGVTANVVVFFFHGVKSALDLADSLKNTKITLAQKNQLVINHLRETAEICHEGVVHLLSSRLEGGSEAGFSHFRSFWLGNKLFIRDANEETVKAVADDPETRLIVEEAIITIPELNIEGSDEKVDDDDVSWGLAKIEVQAAWEELGNKGEGVVVGSIDSGVQGSHEALRDNFVGLDYGWYDPLEFKPEPEDSNGHGTHVMGTLAGSHGIGVAPGAKWMACKGCNNDGCETEAFLSCIEWMACPFHPDGSNKDCTKAPQVVSNSWSVPRGEEQYNDEMLIWRGLGIIPVFAISNEGPGCETTRPPAELPYIIGVGGTDGDDKLYSGSAIGPASDGRIKPDIVAPGVRVKSATRSSESDSKYVTMTGTSMATPHVAGVVALLKARDPSMTFGQAFAFLTRSTDLVNLEDSDAHCDDESIYEYPNIYAGHGRLNALKAVQAQKTFMSQNG